MILATLPAPDSPEGAGWLLMAIGGLALTVNQIISFWKDHMREKPTPSETYLTKKAFEDHKEERRADVIELKTLITQLGTDLKESNKYQAKARQRIHKKTNNHENALYYMAGKLENQGDTHAARVIRERLEASDRLSDED